METRLAGLQGEPALLWAAEIQPVPLHRARVRRARAYLPEADQVFRDDLRMLWRAAGLGKTPLTGDLGVVMTFAGGTDRRPDLTNLLKAVEDAANPSSDRGWLGLWEDDSQVRTLLGEITAWGRGVRPFVTLEAWRLR